MGQKNVLGKNQGQKRKLSSAPSTAKFNDDDVIDLDAEDENDDSSGSQEFLKQIEMAKQLSLIEFQQEEQRALKRSRTEKVQRAASALAWETFFDVNELVEEILSFVSDAQSRHNLIMVRRSRYEKHSAAEKAQLKWLWKSLRDRKLKYADAMTKYEQLIGRMTDTAPLEFVPREKHKMFKRMDRIRGIYSSILYLAALDHNWIGMGHIVALMNNTGILKKGDISCATFVANMIEPLLQYTDAGYGFLDYKVNSDKNIINDIIEMIFHVPIDTFGFFYTKVFTIGGQRQLYPQGNGTVVDREILCAAGERILEGLRRLSNGDNALLLRVVSRLVNVYIDAGSPHGKQVLTSILAKLEKEDIRTLLIANDYYALRYMVRDQRDYVADAALRDSHSPSTHLMAGIELGLLLDFILDTVPKRLADRTAVTALSIICNALRIIAKRYFRGHVDFSRVRAEHILWRLLIDMDCEGVTMVKEGTKILMSKQKHDLRQLLLEKVICGVLVLMPEVRGIPTPAMIVDAQAKGFRDIVMQAIYEPAIYAKKVWNDGMAD